MVAARSTASVPELVYGSEGRTMLHRDLGLHGVLLDRDRRERRHRDGAPARTRDRAGGVTRIAPELDDVLEHVPEPTEFADLVVSPALREQSAA